ncbi:hypothetical protein BO71DRAFT_402653 [Aspergillus ellipticus CBS 707.79]|uniref:Uncharacterized protein n=1 Tax=Aspergillus ellipticus CBS 707.79 TaxID=1448320 RepID=A0A319CYV9_9EURO|nr:hypothetical protein BO71DRAFT_402653 [Aspergillus ellipticus CBS 707.79]
MFRIDEADDCLLAWCLDPPTPWGADHQLQLAILQYCVRTATATMCIFALLVDGRHHHPTDEETSRIWHRSSGARTDTGSCCRRVARNRKSSRQSDSVSSSQCYILPEKSSTWTVDKPTGTADRGRFWLRRWLWHRIPLVADGPMESTRTRLDVATRMEYDYGHRANHAGTRC